MTPHQPLLRLSHVSRETRDIKDNAKTLLDDVTWELSVGKRIALISTSSLSARAFLECAAGVVPPQKGTVTINANISWPLGARGGLINNLTARQNAAFLHGIYGEYGKLNQSLDFISDLAELDKTLFNRPVKNYSKIMRSRLYLAISLAFDFDAYIVPKTFAWSSSASSDRALRLRFQEALMRRVEGKSLIMAHTDFNIVERFCTNGIILDKGIIAFSGSLQECRNWHENNIGSRVVEDDNEIEPSDDNQNQASTEASEEQQGLDDDLW